MSLFSEFQLKDITLKNRVVMSPMTRSRAIGNIPNDLMATYYQQRSEAGLIITEGVAPSANGLGYPRIPGLYSQAQKEGWKKITQAVHAKGGKIFAQLMHTGRASHPENMEKGTKVLAPSAIALEGKVYTDTMGPQPYPVPEEMTIQDIENEQKAFVQSSINAIEAGFDGIEIHGANGYLVNQFINTSSNQRTDNYGGSVENHSRFAIEVARKIAAAIGAEKTGIRLSPYNIFNGMATYDKLEETYEYLSGELGKLGLAYIHLVDHSSLNKQEVTSSVKSKIRRAFGGIIILSGGYDKERAEKDLLDGKGELVAFGRTFLANPDLIHRLEKDLPLNSPDFGTFYIGGEKGYTDYPVYEVNEQN